MKWHAQAPANIALIKYMGKTDYQTNTPSNRSLSYTLDHLLSFVELEKCSYEHDVWQPLTSPESTEVKLSQKAQERFLNHLARIKQIFRYQGSFIVRSANNFPSDCGLASSASSFAALTKAACLALAELTHQPLPAIDAQAKLSQNASGSSCRSFFSPWSLWDFEGVKALALPYHKLIHHVIVVDREKKTTTSSEAHRRVTTSSLFQLRKERAEQRMDMLISALEKHEWEQAKDICWQEFWDMHSLFETASPPFGYLNKNSIDVLTELRNIWQQKKDGPIITMDAGPNVHLLFRPDQHKLADEIYKYFLEYYLIIKN